MVTIAKKNTVLIRYSNLSSNSETYKDKNLYNQSFKLRFDWGLSTIQNPEKPAKLSDLAGFLCPKQYHKTQLI